MVADDTGIAADKKLAKELENLADLCYAMGIKAKDSGIYNYAKSFFNHALLYDPDHKETRKILGFKKKGKEWVADKEDYGMPSRNTIRPEKEDEVYKKIWSDTKAEREKAADKLYEFVADTKLDNKQRVLALHHLMLIDPWHVKGHRAAGMDNTEPGTSTDLWTHKLDADIYHARRDWQKDAPAATAVKDKTPYEDAMGVLFGKARGERFFIHVSCVGSAEQIALNLAPYADATWRKACEYLGTTPEEAPKEDAKRLHYTVIDDRPNYAKFIESCAGIDDAQRRKEIAEQGWGYATRKPTGNVWLYPRPEVDAGLRDGFAHEIGSYSIASKCGYRLYWLNRGFGFTMSNRAVGSVRANFAPVRGSQVIPSDVEAMPGNGTNAAAWRFNVVLAIAGGKTLGLSALTRASSATFGEQQCAFGFAYTEFLLTKYKDKLAPFLKDAYDDTYERYKKKEQPESGDETLARLMKHLDTSSDALQTDFALWAVDNYLKLPK